MKKMNVLIVEPFKKPYTKEINTGLESLQHEVGGYIEAVYPFDDLVALICNEEGKMNGLELNRALRDEDGDIYDIVAGTFLIVGLAGESFCSLPDDLIQKYSELFAIPECFINANGKIVTVPMKWLL